MTTGTIDNFILNGPFEEPSRHWRFDAEGITDEVVEGRRPSAYFMPIPASKRKKAAQQEIVFQEWSEDRIEETRFVNELRDEVTRWRETGWHGATHTSKALLRHWTDPGRARRLYFAQVEAVETAIWLAEVAPDTGKGRYFLNELTRFGEDANPGLFRVAHKMATGTGKTVVAGMLIAWQALNKAADPKSKKHSDAFMLVGPGLTIKDRLRVLMPSDPGNYYTAFDLVPAELRSQLGRVKVVVTNFQAFKRKEKVKVAKATKDLLRQDSDTAGAFTETWDQMVNRVCKPLRGKRQIVVINDEAHHCYQRRPAPAADETIDALTGDEKTEAKTRDDAARQWLSGLRAVQAKLGVRTVYDLSATPFFLNGSGYPEGTLFPWVVSDFGLIDAIEAGLVKIPRVPVEDDTTNPDEDPTYRTLWARIRDSLPKKGRKTDAVTGEPRLPAALQGALHSLYANYARSYQAWETSDAAAAGAAPPVFIVVCNNTNVSKLVFDYLAGWEKPLEDGTTVVVPGALPLFSNEHAGGWADRPVSILVDSQALDSGEAMSPEFKRAAAVEVDRFKAEYVARFPGADASKLTDEDLLREVMNTVGKPDQLGSQIRCVVSVSMLTEGWDANTVTHILGVRAFGTQLLCEQVVGRGLRRRGFALNDQGHFEPEYAEVYGVPFSFLPANGSQAEPEPPAPITHVRALPERADARITFPRLDGYRWEIPDEALHADWTDESQLALTAEHNPTTTEVAGIIGETAVHTLDDLRSQRVQYVAFSLAKVVLDRYFRDDPDDPDKPSGVTGERPWLFPTLVGICTSWIAECVTCTDNAFPQLLLLHEHASDAADRIYRSIVRTAGGDRRLLPILKPYDTIGSTDWVEFDTTKPTRRTDPDKCHVSHVVADTDSWEQRMSQALEELKGVVYRYVKNQGLGFTIPYELDGETHQYVPDFIVDIEDGHGPDDPLHLVIEVTGKNDRAKQAKTDTARTLWVPAVNNTGRYGRWHFVEITDPWDGANVVASIANAGAVTA